MEISAGGTHFCWISCAHVLSFISPVLDYLISDCRIAVFWPRNGYDRITNICIDIGNAITFRTQKLTHFRILITELPHLTIRTSVSLKTSFFPLEFLWPLNGRDHNGHLIRSKNVYIFSSSSNSPNLHVLCFHPSFSPHSPFRDFCFFRLAKLLTLGLSQQVCPPTLMQWLRNLPPI